MLRVCPLVSVKYVITFHIMSYKPILPQEWTDLNPSAPSFTPKDFKFEDKTKDKLKQIDGKDVEKEKSGGNTSERNNRTGSKSSAKTNKPSLLTLEQFITEKLKIE